MKRIFIVSAVRHARQYIPILQRFDDVRIVGIAEPGPAWSQELSSSVARDFGIPMIDLRQGFADADVVLICSEATRRAELAVTAAQAGIPIIIDKPPVLQTAQATNVVSAAQASGTPITTVHRLFSPAVQEARRHIDAGGIGLPLMIDGEWISYGGMDDPVAVEMAELVCDPQLSGGGEFANFGWYPVVAMLYLTGLRVVSVLAFGGGFFHEAHAGYGVEDTAVVSLELTNRVIATVAVTRLPYAGPASSTVRIIGSHGDCLVEEDMGIGVVGVSEQGRGADVVRAVELFFRDALDSFDQGISPILSGDLMWHAVSVVEAVSASLRRGAPISIEGSG